MLNQETKRRIDSARQVLVGKVPDPKAQVEQITTALIYKFMDDMDKEAEELGGKARFFANGYEKYAWTKLMDARLGGHDRLDLYTEAITSLSRNPHIPQLFRDIFKDAFLPYRSPETLSLFLKEVNGFSYEHSEDLGDAFEYLLSILGSQGDAGQFRTPRHIIDFIVRVVDPKKDETVCDPACGTAGFLISAYKHILEQHDGKGNSGQEEKPLTPDERKSLMDHFTGYDISPDMVRLSKVNMYLHGFPNPTIFEYDTLSSEEKWDESFDVMLANPPFMSPKGGIKPHKRFSVQANRSEVLFVDYIKEHLKPNGRAGIIVPEGIIFQSGTVYKQLRKILLEDGLFAVVSLPAGVFQPYSGVKTSILFFDNSLAKQTEDILFVKIQNDGFDLGAQRRPTPDKNDLPNAENTIFKYQDALRHNLGYYPEMIDILGAEIAHLVPKSKILESGDYNFTGDRYKDAVTHIEHKWPLVELGEICEILDSRRKPVTKSDRKSGQYPYYGATGILDYVDGFIFDEKLVLIGEDGAKWDSGEKTSFIATGKYWVNNHAHVLRPLRNKVLDEYIVPLINSMDLTPYITGVTVPKLNQEKLRSIKIPLPPIEVQKDIVEQIGNKQQAIDHAKAIIHNLERERRNFGQSLRRLDGVKWVQLGDVCEINPKKSELQNRDMEVSFVPMSVVQEYNPNFTTNEARKIAEVFTGYTYFRDGDVLLAKITPCFENGKAGIARNLQNGIGFGSTEYIVLRPCEKILPEVIYLLIASDTFRIEGAKHMTGSAGQKRVPVGFVANYNIPVLPLEIQKQLVAEMNKEQAIINANKELITIMEKKITSVLANIT